MLEDPELDPYDQLHWKISLANDQHRSIAVWYPLQEV